jgi:hypothetical protein
MKNPPIVLKKNEIAWIGTTFTPWETDFPCDVTNYGVAYTPNNKALNFGRILSRHQARRTIVRAHRGSFFPSPVITNKDSCLIAFDELSTPLPYASKEEAIPVLVNGARASLMLINELYYSRCYNQCLKEALRVRNAHRITTDYPDTPRYFYLAYELVATEMMWRLEMTDPLRYKRQQISIRLMRTAERIESSLSDLDAFGPVYREIYNLYTPESDDV